MQLGRSFSPRRARSMPVVAALTLSAALVSMARPAAADGSLTMRGAYYKERATRVVQPMLDGTFSAGEHGTVDAHLLVDAITSASSSSGAADDTPFTERRYEGGGGYAHELPWGKLRGDLRISSEPDYFSLFGGGGVELPFAEKNTTVGLSAGLGRDRVTNEGAQGPFSVAISDDLTTVLGAASVSQLLSPELVVSAGYDLSYLRGYQQNPYRFVAVDGNPMAERHPDTRARHALAVTGKWYLPQTRTTAIGLYRFYADSWGILAHTPEVRLLQELGDTVELGLRYRFHLQGAADFYEAKYTQDQRYLTDDEKLSDFTSNTIEGRFAMLGESLGFTGMLGEARGEISIQYINQNNRFGDAIAAQVALTLPFVY